MRVVHNTEFSNIVGWLVTDEDRILAIFFDEAALCAVEELLCAVD